MLSSWRAPLLRRTVDETTQSFYQAYNCCWLESNTCAHFAEGSPEQRWVFATGYNGITYPVQITFDDECEPSVYRLGLPCPTDRLTVDVVEARTKATEPRAYAFAYEDSFGRASALSEPTDVLLIEDGTAALISGWADPGDDWDVQYVRIYRSQAGFESVLKEEANSMDSAWLLVDRVLVTQTSYTDTKHSSELVDAVENDVVEPPPDGLRGITWVQSMNCLVGFLDRTIYFSNNNQYHNWKNRLLLDDNIRAICESNDVIYVATDGPPYVITGKADCNTAACRTALRMPEPLPLIGSGHRSMIETPSGAIYPTHTGLVLMSGNSAPKILTRAFYSPTQWQALQPDTAVLAQHEGRLFAFFRNGAFTLTLPDGAGTSADSDAHSELSLRPTSVLVTRQGKFLLHIGTDVLEWGMGTTYLPHTYTGPLVLSGVPVNFGAAQILLARGVEHVEVLADGDAVLDEDTSRTAYWALPMWAAQSYQWRLSGTGTVQSITLAPSTKEL